MHASTAVSASDASFAQGLVEALAQLAEGAEAVLLAAYDGPATGPLETMRSEEHTSELQSLMRISYAVFCLTKKNPHTNHPPNHTRHHLPVYKYSLQHS